MTENGINKIIELLNEAIRNGLDFQGYDILKIEYYSETEQLIMYLSIQDNPLEYLCSILKE